MGSKRTMLGNGFGEAIIAQAASAERVVDLFAGSGVVAWFAAERTRLRVEAYDLQMFSAVLSRAVISRAEPLDAQQIIDEWLTPLAESLRANKTYADAALNLNELSAERVHDVRLNIETAAGGGPLYRAYAGHYFSPQQAIALDEALATLPQDEPTRSLCHAAVVVAAGYCAAAPGHTAQPFQPTPTALRYIADHWNRDPFAKIQSWIEDVAPRHAGTIGQATVGDAVQVAKALHEGDLVIIDPPYSAVQYSRFYHVLEAVARESNSPVSGIGRYPASSERPRSDFSLKTQSEAALEELFDGLEQARCRALITFPAGQASNGLSGSRIVELAQRRFSVSSKTVLGRFSTLGGNNTQRASRSTSAELIISLRPS